MTGCGRDRDHDSPTPWLYARDAPRRRRRPTQASAATRSPLALPQRRGLHRATPARAHRNGRVLEARVAVAASHPRAKKTSAGSAAPPGPRPEASHHLSVREPSLTWLAGREPSHPPRSPCFTDPYDDEPRLFPRLAGTGTPPDGGDCAVALARPCAPRPRSSSRRRRDQARVCTTRARRHASRHGFEQLLRGIVVENHDQVEIAIGRGPPFRATPKEAHLLRMKRARAGTPARRAPPPPTRRLRDSEGAPPRRGVLSRVVGGGSSPQRMSQDGRVTQPTW